MVKIIRTWLVPPGVVAWVPLPFTVLWSLRHPISTTTLAHELVHVVQWGMFGWTFPFRYFWQWVRVGFNYNNIPFEIEARKHAYDMYYWKWAEDLLEEWS